MGQRSNDAASMDAQTQFKKEESALGIEQSSKYVALKDAQTMSSREEFALDMEQRSNDAASVDALTMPNEEESVLDTGQIAIPMTNLQHFLLIDQHLMTRLQLFPIIAQQRLLSTKREGEILLV